MKYSIYKLVCSETNKIYIGSTSRPLYKRKWGHNSKSNRNLPNRKREEYYIDLRSSILLKKKEFYELNKDKIKINRLLHYYRNHKIEDIKNKQIKKILLERKEKEQKEALKLKQAERLKQKIFCNQCSTFISYRHVSRHNRSPKHLLQGLVFN